MVAKGQFSIQSLIRLDTCCTGWHADRARARRICANRDVPISQADVPIVQNKVRVIVLQLALILHGEDEAISEICKSTVLWN